MVMDPIALLMEDHQRFLETLDNFRPELRFERPAGKVPQSVPRRVAEFALFLARDVDRIHGGKEERGLFPVLGRHIPVEGGPIGIMLGEHEALRGHQRALDRSGRKLESDPEAVESQKVVGTTFRAVEELLAQHITKEDSMLFPMASQVLSREEVLEIGRVFDEVDSEFGSSRN